MKYDSPDPYTKHTFVSQAVFYPNDIENEIMRYTLDLQEKTAEHKLIHPQEDGAVEFTNINYNFAGRKHR